MTRLSQSRDGTQLATFAHSYDTAGNLTRRTFEHRSGDPSEDYAYDSLYRLTRTEFGQRSGDPYEGFVYDDLGNHLTQDHDGVEIAGLFNDVNEQTDRGAASLTWSLRGNLTEDDDGQQYAYDRSNLLTEVKDDQGNVIATYTYDALGRRIEKDASGGGGDTTRFYYDDQQVIEERDDNGTLQRQYVWGGVYIDELLLFTDVAGEGGTADADYLVLRHHNFNAVGLVDRSDGSVVERYDYNPYGERTVRNPDFTTHSDATAGSFAFAIGHQGLLHDHESGLVYNRARMLHPGFGRWLQREPYGYIDGMNLYQYVTSNPLVFVDPDGLFLRSIRDFVLGIDSGKVERNQRRIARRGREIGRDDLARQARRTGADFRNNVGRESWEQFGQTANDRLNGYGDAIGVDGVAEHLGGTDRVFDPSQARRGECLLNCMKQKPLDLAADAAYSALAPYGLGAVTRANYDPHSNWGISISPITGSDVVGAGIDSLHGASRYGQVRTRIGSWASSGMARYSASQGNFGATRNFLRARNHLGSASRGLGRTANRLLALQYAKAWMDCYGECEEDPCRY